MGAARLESRTFRIDTIGEKRGLRLAKLIKNKGWLKPIKKVKVI